jgi:hypothetical protein
LRETDLRHPRASIEALEMGRDERLAILGGQPRRGLRRWVFLRSPNNQSQTTTTRYSREFEGGRCKAQYGAPFVGRRCASIVRNGAIKVRYNPALDGVRAIAIGLVFATHFYEKAVPGGWIGVDVFFVLSGYLITSILLNELRQSGRISLSNFYMRRLLRLRVRLRMAIGEQFA